MTFELDYLPEELKYCEWCEHWQGDLPIAGKKECLRHKNLVDISGEPTVLTRNIDSCDEFQPNGPCIAEARMIWQEENHIYEYGDEYYNGVTAGIDFPYSLTR